MAKSAPCAIKKQPNQPSMKNFHIIFEIHKNSVRIDSRMDGDISNERSGRGEGEDAIDQLSHRISDYLDTEFNNLSDFSTLDWHTLEIDLLLLQREPENFQCERTSTLLPQSQSPAAVQVQDSLQIELPENSIRDELKEIPVLDVPEQEDYSFQHTQSFTFIPTNLLPPTRQQQVPLQNQDRDFMYGIDQNPQLQTDQAAFTMLQEKLSPEAFVHTVSESMIDAQQQYQQQIPHHVSSPTGREPLSPSSKYTHDPQPLMSTVALKPTSQMDRDFMYRIKQNSQLQTEEAAFTMPQELLSLEALVRSVSQSTADQQQYQENIQEEPRHQQVPLPVSSQTGREPLSPSSTYMQYPHPLMSTVSLKPPSQMDRDFMYRIRQNSQLQTEEAAFTGPQELLSLEALVRSVSESTADQQQYQENIQEEPRHQQVSLHVSSLSGRAPQSRSSTNMHEPQPLMSKVAQKVPSQMTMGQLSTRRNPEEMKNMEGIQQSELNFMKERTDLHSRMHEDHPSARSGSNTVKDTEEKMSDEARHDSVKENDISSFPQHNEPNPERMKGEEEEIQKLAERMKFRRKELALTQEDVADQLNNLSRKHKIGEYLLKKYVSKIENNKISPKRMLQLKPLLELWLGSTRKESHEKN